MTFETKPDYKSYPGDRNTRQTPAQRDRKRYEAAVHARAALRNLDDLLTDFEANSYRLNVAEREEWRTAADLATQLSKIVAALRP